jgi:hypothetical protein
VLATNFKHVSAMGRREGWTWQRVKALWRKVARYWTDRWPMCLTKLFISCSGSCDHVAGSAEINGGVALENVRMRTRGRRGTGGRDERDERDEKGDRDDEELKKLRIFGQIKLTYLHEIHKYLRQGSRNPTRHMRCCKYNHLLPVPEILQTLLLAFQTRLR